MKQGEYDVHIAAEGLTREKTALETKLKEAGFKDDRLTSRQVTFLEGAALSCCPLIGVHMSKKGYSDVTEAREDMELLKTLLLESGLTGYAHSEYTRAEHDMTITSSQPLRLTRPLPVQRLEGRLRQENKRWDMHIAIPKDRLPVELGDAFKQMGFYHMDIMKTREDKDREFRVYTIQGISPMREGKLLYEEMRTFLSDVHTPHAEMKLEATVDMFRIGDPKIVPPTIDQVSFVDRTRLG